MVQTIESLADYQHLIAQPKLTVIDFHALWCGPCKVIKPLFAQLASANPDVNFAQVDVDQAKDVAQVCGITAMPTFHFYRAGSKLDELRGASPNDLKALVQKHKSGAQASTSKVDDGAPAGFASLKDFISMNQVDCLNEKSSHPARHIFTTTDSTLESDVDEQIIFSLPFNQKVKVHSFKITAPKDKGPKTIKTFINFPHTLSFDEAESTTATEDITLKPEDLNGDKLVQLRFVKYQNVDSIQFFIVDNQEGGEVTVIQNLTLYGCPLETTNMAELKKTEDD